MHGVARLVRVRFVEQLLGLIAAQHGIMKNNHTWLTKDKIQYTQNNYIQNNANENGRLLASMLHCKVSRGVAKGRGGMPLTW